MGSINQLQMQVAQIKIPTLPRKIANLLVSKFVIFLGNDKILRPSSQH